MDQPKHVGYVDPSYPSPLGPDDADIVIYGYIPSLALSILALVLYALLLIAHSIRLYLHRTKTFAILTLIGCVFELVGYAFRLRSARPPIGDPYNIINFVIQYFFIVVAPVFFSAAIYTTLTTMIAALGTAYSPLGLSRRLILTIFISCDVGATVVQIAGSAMIGSAEANRRDPRVPNDILIAGLAFQVFAFFVFLALLGLFIFKARKGTSSRGEGGMMQFTVALVVASLLIYLRTCFRLAETAEGVMGYASTHEALYGPLEFAPVVLAVGILAWWHPGKWIPRL